MARRGGVVRAKGQGPRGRGCSSRDAEGPPDEARRRPSAHMVSEVVEVPVTFLIQDEVWSAVLDTQLVPFREQGAAPALRLAICPPLSPHL